MHTMQCQTALFIASSEDRALFLIGSAIIQTAVDANCRFTNVQHTKYLSSIKASLNLTHLPFCNKQNITRDKTIIYGRKNRTYSMLQCTKVKVYDCHCCFESKIIFVMWQRTLFLIVFCFRGS